MNRLGHVLGQSTRGAGSLASQPQRSPAASPVFAINAAIRLDTGKGIPPSRGWRGGGAPLLTQMYRDSYPSNRHGLRRGPLGPT